MSYDREKCVCHPTIDGQGGQDGANTAQGDRVVNVLLDLDRVWIGCRLVLV